MFEVGAFKLLVWAAWVSAVLWLLLALITWRWLARRKFLSAATPGRELTAESAPLISIIVPARNEEGRVLQDCIHSILAQDYRRFEVIAVNDRSTDATAMILRSVAETDERLRVIDGA